MADEWVQLNMLTGEIKPISDDPKPRRHRSDPVFTAGCKLWGLAGQPLTDSKRGEMNRSCKEIKHYEWELDEVHTDEEIAALFDGFDPWFISYRRERFNENCTRCPYPMETAKLWPEYRKKSYSVPNSWRDVIEAQKANPNSVYNRMRNKDESSEESE